MMPSGQSVCWALLATSLASACIASRSRHGAEREPVVRVSSQPSATAEAPPASIRQAATTPNTGDNTLEAVWVSDSGHVFIAGADGMIIYTDTGPARAVVQPAC